MTTLGMQQRHQGAGRALTRRFKDQDALQVALGLFGCSLFLQQGGGVQQEGNQALTQLLTAPGGPVLITKLGQIVALLTVTGNRLPASVYVPAGEGPDGKLFELTGIQP